MLILVILPLALQGIAMIVDEGWFHRRRGLPRWERIGHPIDTLSIALCLGWLVLAERTTDALWVYGALAAGSTLLVTKDEGVHARRCSAGEHWVHALLFVLHPIVLAALAVAWWRGHGGVVAGQLVAVVGFLAYQIVYWNAWRPPEASSTALVPVAAVAVAAPASGPIVRLEARPATPAEARVEARPEPRADARIDNRWYGPLGARWYDAEDSPIALLRAEARHRNPWIARELAAAFGARVCRVLDLGCGGGFLANDLAARGHRVVGLDTTVENLEVARARDTSRTVTYQLGDARRLPFPDASFDVVCAMDLLEHVEQPAQVVAEASRVLAPGGLFFFHTFNRTWLANLIVIKGVSWFVRNTPANLHVLALFLTPEELRAMCTAHGLEIAQLRGSRPRFRWPLWRMIATGRVGDDFEFTFTGSTQLGYTGWARKQRQLVAGAPDLA